MSVPSIQNSFDALGDGRFGPLEAALTHTCVTEGDIQVLEQLLESASDGIKIYYENALGWLNGRLRWQNDVSAAVDRLNSFSRDLVTLTISVDGNVVGKVDVKVCIKKHDVLEKELGSIGIIFRAESMYPGMTTRMRPHIDTFVTGQTFDLIYTRLRELQANGHLKVAAEARLAYAFLTRLRTECTHPS